MLPKSLQETILLQKLQTLDFALYFIPCTGLVTDQFGLVVTGADYAILQRAWQVIHYSGRTNQELAKQAWLEVDSCGVSINKMSLVHSMVRRRLAVPKPEYFALVDDEGNAPVYALQTLANHYQVEKGFLPLHVGAVIRNEGLYLFGGPSGAGKSTISALSAGQGGWVLDEDQVLLKPQNPLGVTAQAWGYSLQASEVPLRAVFKLVKAEEDQAIRLTKTQTARFLFERSTEVIGDMHKTQFGRKTFQLASVVARDIPGYELHFRKSPDFWKLIDAEFGLD